MSGVLGRRVLPTMLPSFAVAATMIAVDGFLGSAAYGIAAIFPGIAITAAQSIELVRAQHVRGVSPVSMALGFLNLTLWFGWAVLVRDPGTIIALSISWVIALFNVIWYALRRLGLRPFFLRVPELALALQEF